MVRRVLTKLTDRHMANREPGEASTGEKSPRAKKIWTREGLEMGMGVAKVGRVGASERAVQVLSVLAQAASPLPDLLRLPCLSVVEKGSR